MGFGYGPGAGYGGFGGHVGGAGYGAAKCGAGYGAPVGGAGRGFALIVVLFILLIIVGAAWF